MLPILFIAVCVAVYNYVLADGTYGNIGTSAGSNGGYDAVSWSQGYPIMIDSYGKFIVPVQHSTGGLRFAYSNNDGEDWSETTTGNVLINRTSAVYDSRNDRIHSLMADADGVVYKRFIINRDKNYDIVSIELDSTTAPLEIEAIGECAADSYANPIILWYDNGDNGVLLIFWSYVKTGCSGTDIAGTRGAIRDLSDLPVDGSAAAWGSITGVDDGEGAVSPATLDYYSELYQYIGSVSHPFQHAAYYMSGDGATAQDLYYFTSDETDTYGFTRYIYNEDENFWTTNTGRTEFGGSVDNSNGYSLKHELLSKPVFASGQDKVYIGIARWLAGGLGDTQSLYSVAVADDAVTLESNIYSASGAHCLYPTFDLMYDETDDKLYFFYLISGASSVCGHTYYKTYDGTTFSDPVAYYTVPNRSVDIPITYPSRYKDKIHLFYRLNNAADNSTPPHEIHYGTVALSDSINTPSVAAGTSPYTASTYSQFTQTCRTLTNTEALNTSGGEIGIESKLSDDFETPTTPYTMVWKDFWLPQVWTGGTFDPSPSGTVTVYNSGGGAYLLGVPTATQKTLEFRAQFTNHNFQHVGWVPDNSFGQYLIFSTHNNGQLNARVENTGGETISNLGTSYYGAFHTYRIEWGASNVLFYIDNTLVSTVNQTSATAMIPIVSNNTVAAGSNLEVDWLRVKEYPVTTGTYRYCSLDGGSANVFWDTASYTATTSGGTVTYQTRSSADNETWSDWSTAQTSNTSILSSAARYLQIMFNLSGSGTQTPTVNDFSITFSKAPATPASLLQYASDGTTSITTGGSTTDTTLVFKSTMTDGDTSDSLTAEIEVRPLGTSFTSVPTATSSAVAYSGSGVTSSITLSSGLVAGTSYHWQSRVCDENQCSAWVSYGSNAESVADFIISQSAAVSSNSTETVSGGVFGSACSQEGPTGKLPWLYAIVPESHTTVRLYFTPSNPPFDHYAVAFGRSSGSQEYGADMIGDSSTRSYLVSDLQPDTTYYFKVRTGNGCAPSQWSNELSVTTKKRFEVAQLSFSNVEIADNEEELDEVAQAESEAKNADSDNEDAARGAQLTVTVVDGSSGRVAGVTVKLDNEVIKQTDSNGQVSFGELKTGEHELVVTSDDYTGEQKLYISEGESKVDLTISIDEQSLFKQYLLPILFGLAGLLSLFLVWKLFVKHPY